MWIVEGRIYNTSGVERVSKVKLRITMRDKQTHHPVDGGDIELKMDIPPWTVRAFSREIQLLPPNDEAPFEWDYEVTLVAAEL